VIDYPGNILNYYHTENVSDAANRAFATGDAVGDVTTDGTGDSTVVTWGVSENVSAGYPLLESVANHSGVTDQVTINSHAASDLASKPVPTITHTFDLDPVQDPVFGTYALGDDARVQITDARFPEGTDDTVRVVGWSVKPGESDGTESVSLVLQEDDTAGMIGS
jgi:hypothetical protein